MTDIEFGGQRASETTPDVTHRSAEQRSQDRQERPRLDPSLIPGRIQGGAWPPPESLSLPERVTV